MQWGAAQRYLKNHYSGELPTKPPPSQFLSMCPVVQMPSELKATPFFLALVRWSLLRAWEW